MTQKRKNSKIHQELVGTNQGTDKAVQREKEKKNSNQLNSKNTKFGPFRTTNSSQRENPEKLSPIQEEVPIHPFQSFKNNKSCPGKHFQCKVNEKWENSIVMIEQTARMLQIQVKIKGLIKA